jgi:hypothetical protein
MAGFCSGKLSVSLHIIDMGTGQVTGSPEPYYVGAVLAKASIKCSPIPALT